MSLRFLLRLRWLAPVFRDGSLWQRRQGTCRASPEHSVFLAVDETYYPSNDTRPCRPCTAHGRGVVHADLKRDNIFFDKQLNTTDILLPRFLHHLPSRNRKLNAEFTKAGP